MVGDRRRTELDGGQAQELSLSGIEGWVLYVEDHTWSTSRQTRVQQLIEARGGGDEWAVWTVDPQSDNCQRRLYVTSKTRTQMGAR